MRVEALSRVQAEAELRKRHAMEYERLLKRNDGDHVAAVAALVAKRGKEYTTYVAAARDRLQAQARSESVA